jgi:hypothetical protein
MWSKLSGLSRNGLKRFDSLKRREQQLVDCGPFSRGQRIVQVLCGMCHSSTRGRTATTAKSKPDIDIPHISGEDTLYVQSTQSLPDSLEFSAVDLQAHSASPPSQKREGGDAENKSVGSFLSVPD